VIRIHINGEEKTLEAVLTLQELLNQMRLTSVSLAIAINDEVIPRSQIETHIVRANDRVEIIRAVGGG